MIDDVELYDPNQPGLFPAPLQFCGASMGGYGDYKSVGEHQGVLEVIVPVDMVAGESIDTLNGQEYRERFARALLGDAYAIVKLPEPMCEGRPEIDAGCGAVATHDGHDVIFAFPGGSKHYRSPLKATELAGAILAAAHGVDGAR